jgi:hypothetical protein
MPRSRTRATRCSTLRIDPRTHADHPRAAQQREPDRGHEAHALEAGTAVVTGVGNRGQRWRIVDARPYQGFPHASSTSLGQCRGKAQVDDTMAGMTGGGADAVPVEAPEAEGDVGVEKCRGKQAARGQSLGLVQRIALDRDAFGFVEIFDRRGATHGHVVRRAERMRERAAHHERRVADKEPSTRCEIRRRP